MTKNIAIVLSLIMLTFAAWALLLEHSAVSISINGQPVAAAWVGAVGITGLAVGAVTLFCLAILLAFVFAGIGLLVLGGFVFAGLLVAWMIFPLLLLLLIPLAIVWAFIALSRKL